MVINVVAGRSAFTSVVSVMTVNVHILIFKEYGIYCYRGPTFDIPVLIFFFFHIPVSCSNPKSITSELDFLHLRFSSV